MSQNSNKRNWYGHPTLIDILLFLFPPLGVYAIYKSKETPEPIKIIIPMLLFGMACVLAYKIVQTQ